MMNAMAAVLVAALLAAPAGDAYAQSVIDRLKDAGKQAVEKAKEAGSKAKEKVKEEAEEARQKAKETTDRAKQKAAETADKVKREVKEEAQEVKERVQQRAAETRQSVSARVAEEDWGNWKAKLKNDSNHAVEERKQRLQQVWNDIPADTREELKAKTRKDIILPVPYHSGVGASSGGSGLTAVRIAPLEGRVYFYEPSMNQVKTLLTNEAVGAATHGAVKVDNIEDMGIRKVGVAEYEVSVDAEVKLLWFIPVKMQGKATVDTQDRQVSYGDVSVKRIDKPWWSVLVTGVVEETADEAYDAVLTLPQ
jgi:hypothetical protein